MICLALGQVDDLPDFGIGGWPELSDIKAVDDLSGFKAGWIRGLTLGTVNDLSHCRPLPDTRPVGLKGR